MAIEKIRQVLVDKHLKVTPQRIAVLEAVTNLNNHPTADDVKKYVYKKYPNIALGTVYKVLEMLVENQIIKKVKTEKDVMRYDAITSHHHHLYCEESSRIEDYFDEGLNKLLADYFSKKNIPDFKIKEVKLQILGNFTDES